MSEKVSIKGEKSENVPIYQSFVRHMLPKCSRVRYLGWGEEGDGRGEREGDKEEEEEGKWKGTRQ